MSHTLKSIKQCEYAIFTAVLHGDAVIYSPVCKLQSIFWATTPLQFQTWLAIPLRHASLTLVYDDGESFEAQSRHTSNTEKGKEAKNCCTGISYHTAATGRHW